MAVKYTQLMKCVYCKVELVCRQTETMHHNASVWTGSEWTKIKHGTKECPKCKGRYKLSYLAEKLHKWNTIKTLDDNPIVLLHNDIGFTCKYLKQHFNRACRCDVSGQGEAATILLTFPDAETSKSDMSKVKGGTGKLNERNSRS